jgi:hypothetical protein
MATGPKFFIGNVGSEGVSTGPHIHQYVKDLKTGNYIDPRTLQSPLLNVRIGEQEVPLAIKDASGKITFNPAAGATITSEYGTRSAPTAGASSFHQGRDIALAQGTPVKYVGAGTFTPQTGVQGFGNLGTITTPDQRYEIGFGHMSSLGKPFSASGGISANAENPSAVNYANSQQRTNDLLEAFMYGTQYNRENTSSPQSFLDQAKMQIAQSLLAPKTFTPPPMSERLTQCNLRLSF